MFTDTTLASASKPQALHECLSRFLRALEGHDLASFASRLELILPGEPPMAPVFGSGGLAGILPDGTRPELLFSGGPDDEEMQLTAFDSSGQALLSRRFKLN